MIYGPNTPAVERLLTDFGTMTYQQKVSLGRSWRLNDSRKSVTIVADLCSTGLMSACAAAWRDSSPLLAPAANGPITGLARAMNDTIAATVGEGFVDPRSAAVLLAPWREVMSSEGVAA